jgi:hypothetical protein
MGEEVEAENSHVSVVFIRRESDLDKTQKLNLQ